MQRKQLPETVFFPNRGSHQRSSSGKSGTARCSQSVHRIPLEFQHSEVSQNPCRHLGHWNTARRAWHLKQVAARVLERNQIVMALETTLIGIAIQTSVPTPD